jgi:hypothetical protein
MEPNKITKVVGFYNGATFTLPTNWQAMLSGGYSGDENHLMIKKFPPKTKLHPEPLTNEQKELALGRDKFVIKQPTVMVDYFTSSDAGQAYYNIVDAISGIYPRPIKESRTDEEIRGMSTRETGDTLFRLSPDNKEVRGEDIPGAVKCAVHAMDYFTKNSPRIFDKKLVVSRTEEQLKACLIAENTDIKFSINIPERWK